MEQAVLNYFPKDCGGEAAVRLSDSGRLASAVLRVGGKLARGRAWVPRGEVPDNTLRLAFYRAAVQLISAPPWG
ncbi:MAG: hypothetical protein LBR72_00160, partial [Oscillospiraceae bacterium]|nr:hypothetical protein [Oscillospiraceae bacterium]